MARRKKKKTLGQELREILWLLVLVLLVRTLVFQPFVIPTGSMYPTLMVGDYLVVNKYKYGYSRYSILLGKYLPDFNRVWASPPTRGDVVVFREEKTSGLDYIKRLIGMPGDTVQVTNGRLYINNQLVPRQRVADEMYQGKKVATYKETLPNGVSYHIYEIRGDRGNLDNTGIYTVPQGHYFMMGDNRDGSSDSRCMGQYVVYVCGGIHVGYIAENALIGPARMVIFSFKDGILKFWKWFSGARTERFFTKIN